MGTRGRQSGASLAIAAIDVTSVARPDAPYDLDDERAVEEWHAVVARMPADWFQRETHGNLTNYCKHIAANWYIGKLIQECINTNPFDFARYNEFLKAQERESRAASSLATRLRITPQSMYDEKKKRPIESGKTPWD